MKFRYLFGNFSKLLLEDLVYPVLLAFLIIVELMFNLLVSSEASTKYPSILVMNFFFALILAMYLLKKDTVQNRYLKQRVNDYYLYVVSQISVLLVANLVTAVISGIFTFLFSSSPAANGTMILALVTTSWVGTAIAFVCRSQWTSHEYIAAASLIIIVLLALADSNNNVLIYINWVLPPVSNLITTFQEHSHMLAMIPLVMRQFVYAIILFVISVVFNKKNYAK